ncbi:hypothetical protein Pcinc_027271 [Petrolisthes cinctipes]|uniref:Uncharacterized protein n=1 Tax=Petrolisthes cinctipes TaxID=88211 RepID=A0AAE1F5P0_PETCI|nr:hypothetical protein Pcinc_027271 [Petrolisthes cinctipes]
MVTTVLRDLTDIHDGTNVKIATHIFALDGTKTNRILKSLSRRNRRQKVNNILYHYTRIQLICYVML